MTAANNRTGMRPSQDKGARSCRLQAFSIACVTALIARLPSSTACSWRESVAPLDCSRGVTDVSQDPCISAVWPGRPTSAGSVGRLPASPDTVRAIAWPATRPGRPCSRPLSQYGLNRYHRGRVQVRSRYRRCQLGCTNGCGEPAPWGGWLYVVHPSDDQRYAAQFLVSPAGNFQARWASDCPG